MQYTGIKHKHILNEAGLLKYLFEFHCEMSNILKVTRKKASIIAQSNDLRSPLLINLVGI